MTTFRAECRRGPPRSRSRTTSGTCTSSTAPGTGATRPHGSICGCRTWVSSACRSRSRAGARSRRSTSRPGITWPSSRCGWSRDSLAFASGTAGAVRVGIANGAYRARWRRARRRVPLPAVARAGPRRRARSSSAGASWRATSGTFRRCCTTRACRRSARSSARACAATRCSSTCAWRVARPRLEPHAALRRRGALAGDERAVLERVPARRAPGPAAVRRRARRAVVQRRAGRARPPRGGVARRAPRGGGPPHRVRGAASPSDSRSATAAWPAARSRSCAATPTSPTTTAWPRTSPSPAQAARGLTLLELGDTFVVAERFTLVET